MRSFIRRLFCFRPQTRTGSRSNPSLSARRNMGSSTAAVLYAVTVSVSPTSTLPEDASKKSHHVQGGFTNPWDSWRNLEPFKIGKALISRRIYGQSNAFDTTPPTVPVQKPQFLPTRDTTQLRATWLGHACYYVEFPGGLRVLFDPVFEERCSPISWLGPKRYTDAPCKISEIPTIDAVVISHNHYDHLSYPTVKEIYSNHPNCHFFVPLGNKPWFNDSEIQNVTELDWWEQRDLTLTTSEKQPIEVVQPGDSASQSTGITARISCLPCQHTTARSPFDRQKTLWASWAVESGSQKVYFAGDTGYRAVPELADDIDDHGPEHQYPVCPAFKQVGEFRGPFDLGLIPIGAYDPRWIMSPMHADPHDAVNILQDTQCKKALGMHWGTWVLTEEDVLEPPKRLKAALKRNNLPETGLFDICEIGESREF